MASEKVLSVLRNYFTFLTKLQECAVYIIPYHILKCKVENLLPFLLVVATLLKNELGSRRQKRWGVRNDFVGTLRSRGSQ